MALRPTKGMLTSGSSYPTKGLPGETDPFDPNARTTTSFFRDEIPPGDEPSPSIPGDDNDGGVLVDGVRVTTGEVFEMLTAIIVGTQGVPEGTPAEVLAQLEGREYDSQAQLDAAVRQIVNESFDKAQEIVDTMVDNPEALEGMEDPGALTKVFIEQGGLQFAGAAATTPTTTVGGREVIRGGAGVTVNVKDIVESGNYQDVLDAIVPYIPGVSLPNWMPTAGVIFLPTVGEAINKVNDIAGQIGEAIEDGESIGGILEDIGAIVIQEGEVLTDELKTKWEEVTDKIKKVFTEPKRDDDGNIIYKKDEDGNIIYDKDGNAVAETTINPTGVAGVLAGVITGSYPDALPSWMPDLLGGILIENLPNIYNSVRDILIGSGATTTQIFPPAPTTEPDPDIPIGTDPNVDPTLMFTNRGNNYFVSSEGDEYFQLAESEDLDFELNGQYTREQLENTGLETIGSGTYQSLIDDLSFHALEEDIYEYSLEDLRTRYEEEGGIIPGDWKEMDDESKYGFLLDDYFEIPTQISDPDRGEPPTEPEPPVTVPEPEPEPPIDQPEPEPEPPIDQPEPEPEPPVDQPEPDPDPEPQPDPDPDVTSVVEGLFADFLEQLDTEFTGQQDQINTIINNFVETLPDFDAMPTMADIAEYFEINGVTLSQQNFDRIREELSNAGYLTQEQLTEALQGVATPEQVQQAIEGAGFATPEQVIQALAEAGYATPDDITTALANSNLVTEDRMLLALGEAGYATPEQVEQIVTNAVSNIVIPEGATTEEVRQLIQEAVSGLPAGISLDDVSGVVNEAIANIDFPPSLSSDDVRGIVDSFGFATSTDVQAGFDDLNDRFDDAVNGLATQFSDQEAEFLASITGLEASFIQSLASVEGGLSTELEMLGTDIISLQQNVAGRFDEFEQTVGQQLTQAEQDRIRIEQGLYNALQLQSQGQAVELDEAEARLLAEITGGDAALLQEMSSQTGALENQLTSLGLNLNTVQQNLSQDISDLQEFTGFGFSEAEQQRQNLQQALIVANADITQLSSDMFAQFQAQNENVEELFEGTDVNIEALQQGQISQAQALAQYAESTDVRLGLGEDQREEILTRQEEFEQIYGEGQAELQEQIQTGNVVTALAASGMFGGGGGGGTARRPYEEFMKGITYRPREAPKLAIKTPAIDYNEEAQQLLMRTRRRGMLV